MICEQGESTVSISRQDIWIAIENFLNLKSMETRKYKITDMKIHHGSCKKPITVEVVKPLKSNQPLT